MEAPGIPGPGLTTDTVNPSQPRSLRNQGSIGLRVDTKKTITTYSTNEPGGHKESEFSLPTPESLCTNPFEQEESVGAPSLTEPSMGESGETLRGTSQLTGVELQLNSHSSERARTRADIEKQRCTHLRM